MTLFRRVRLVHGARELELDESSGYLIREFDLGFPAPRESEDDKVGADGVQDDTEFHGASAVSMELQLVTVPGWTVTQLLDELRWFCRPGLRPQLLFEVDGDERMVTLRADQQSAPMGMPGERRVQATWRNPKGVQESTELVVTSAAAASSESGRTYPLVHPRIYPASSSKGSVLVDNEGNHSALPVIRIYGPCDGPRIENQTNDTRLVFDEDMVVAAGTFLEIDCDACTITLNGVATQSRYNRLDFPASVWLSLEPGVNRMRFYPVDWSGAAQAQIRHRHTNT